MKNFFTILVLLLSLSLFSNSDSDAFCSKKKNRASCNVERAHITLNSIFKLYSTDNPALFRETYPYNDKYEAKIDSLSIQILEQKIIPGLNLYLDTKRTPSGYASYLDKTPKPDRFYDDNVWIGIDFTDLFLSTKDSKYLSKAVTVWKFIESGTDLLLGGGIYWCEQRKDSKNTCSNAPGAVFALKLFEATNDSSYLQKGKQLYEWTKANLQDKNDYLYYDNINRKGNVDKTKFAYNSGQMLQAAALLYKFTNNDFFLEDAQNLAQSYYKQFFYNYTTPQGEDIYLLKNGDVWFTAVMCRGFIELYNIDKTKNISTLLLLV